MHYNKLSMRQRMMLKQTEKYCGCSYCIMCGCGRWEEHHSDVKYMKPIVLRPFDELRHVIKSLWSPIVEGVRAGCKFICDTGFQMKEFFDVFFTMFAWGTPFAMLVMLFAVYRQVGKRFTKKS